MWKPISDPPVQLPEDMKRASRKKPRFLVDENLGKEVADILCDFGCNATDAASEGLAGRPDEQVFATAWEQRRLIVTLDTDYLDDRRFPRHRNPGVIVLPDRPRESKEFARALHFVINIIGPFSELYRQTKIIIKDREISVILQEADTGVVRKTRYRLPPGRHVFEWVDDGE